MASKYQSHSVPGGWQTFDVKKNVLIGPVFNDAPKLWDWQRDNLSAKDPTPQLPGIVQGYAFQDSMGGVSIEIVDDPSELEEAMEKRLDSEAIYIIPADELRLILQSLEIMADKESSQLAKENNARNLLEWLTDRS